MDLHYLKLFHALAAEGNFTKAAETLFISQPALSVQIKKFEDELGLKLFDKVGNRIVLNENGRLLFEHSKKIFDAVEKAEHELLDKREGISGVISVGGSNTPGTYFLPKIVGEFKKLYPGVNINLHISNTDDIASMISGGKLDFAVNGGNPAYTGPVYVEKLVEDRVILAASPENKLAGREKVSPADLSGANFIAHESSTQMYKLAEDIIEEMNLTSDITMTFGNIDAIKQAVAANLGISPLPLSSARLELKLGIIRELKVSGKSWFYPYNLIYNKKRYMSPAAVKFMDLVRKRIKELQPEIE